MTQRLVGYIRVSTKAGREDDRFLSPELQRADMERWAAARYMDPEWVAWYVEIDRTGTTQTRPVLAKALEDAERSGAALVVFALSRWARNVEGGLRDMDRMREAGVRVETASEPVGLESAIGRFGVQILLAVAELEVGQKAEGWRSTIEVNKSAGLWHGVVPYGYRRPTPAEVKRIGRRSGVMASGRAGRLCLSVVSGFELGWRDVSDGGVKAGGVPPVDPRQGGQLDVVGGAPRSSVTDQFALVETDHRLGQGVVVGITAGPDRSESRLGGPDARCRRWTGIARVQEVVATAAVSGRA